MGGLLAALCLLHVLNGVARAGSLGSNIFGTARYDRHGGGCSACDLDNMVTNCPLDVMFVLDMSDSIPHLTFERARLYVANQIQAVNDAFEGTEIGFMAFSKMVYDEEAIEARNSSELLRMIERVRNVKQKRYGTQLGAALRRARNALDAHRRSGYPYGSLRPHGKLIVLVSDGCEDRNGSVYKEAISAMANNISIISVAIGDSYIDFLNKISLQVLELRTNIDWHSIVACPSTYLPPVPQHFDCGNVMFAMDGSDSVRRWETVMRNYLAFTFPRYSEVVNAMGVVIFGTNANDQSPDTILRLSYQKSQLAELVENSLKFPTDRGTGTTQAIEVAVQNLQEGPIDTPSYVSRTPISKTIIIITDGQALSPEHARQAVRNALDLGIQVIVVGVGNVITEEELREMAGSGSVVLQVNSYLELFAVDFSKYFCNDGCVNYGPCPSRNQVRDITRNCQCQCPSNIVCSANQRLDTTTCNCVPICTSARSCEAGFEFNFTSCGCERTCYQTTPCSTGYYFDENRCQCVPRACTITSCPNGFTLDQTRTPCKCVPAACTITSCPYGFTLDRTRTPCECVPVACTITSCPYGFTLDRSRTPCECVPRACTITSCPNGFTLDQTRTPCECVPVACTITSCPYGFTLDRSRTPCECVPRACTITSCPNGFTLDQTRTPCECVPVACTITSCPYGFTLDRSRTPCECVPRACTITSCPNGFTLDQTRTPCECVPVACTITNCPYGFTLDRSRTPCECVPRACTITSCPNGFTLDQTRTPCECVPVACTITSCPYGFTLDRTRTPCECVPAACTITSCPYGFTLDRTRTPCECVPIACTITSCPYGFTLNRTRTPCDCEPICTNVRSCEGNYEFSYTSCECECNERCYYPFDLDEGSCSCECASYIDCPGNQQLNTTTCGCESRCPNAPVCGAGYDLNYTSCECERTCYQTSPCSAGYYFDEVICQCVPRDCPLTNCPVGFTLDRTRCQCECERTCSYPLQVNRGSCTCECPDRLFCSANQQPNYDTCSCECASNIVCPGNQQLDNTTCSCGCPNRLFCSGNQQPNYETCSCDCPNRFFCSANQEPNYDTCSCECASNIVCPGNQQVDPISCSCGCPNRIICSVNEQPNYETCSCECASNIVCPGNQQVDPVSCSCEPRCPNAPVCGAGYELNYTSCECERTCYQTSPCSAGYYFDEIICQCVSRDCAGTSCPDGTTLDRTRCECVCTRSCPSGYTLDTNTCRCERNICNRTCSSTETLDENSCTCVPNHVQYCSGSELQCQNGQPAVKDCRGRCICNCDVSQFVGKYCEIPVTPHLCDNCTFTNGHYMAPVSDRCDMFVVCQRLEDGSFKPSISLCAEGTILKENGFQLTCDSPESAGVCPVDPCRNQRDGTLIGHSTLCGRYWKCNGGVTTDFECCPSGQGFDKASGRCVPDSNCPNHCAQGFQSCGTSPRVFVNTCPYKTVEGDPNKFFSPLALTAIMPCPPNKIFDVDICTCVQNPNGDCGPYYDIDFDTALDSSAENVDLLSGIQSGNGMVGLFKGDSRIIMTRFSGSGFYFDYLEMTLRVKLADNVNFNSGRQMAIVSNGDCGNNESIAITTDGQRVYFKVTPVGSTSATVVDIPYTTTNDGWLNIGFRYVRQGGTNTFRLTATVNGQTKDTTVKGVIAERQCSLQLGHGLGYDSLEGYVDDFKLWICKPDSSSPQ